MPFISFPPPPALPATSLAGNSSAVLNKNVKKGHPCLVSDIMRKMINFSSLGLIVVFV